MPILSTTGFQKLINQLAMIPIVLRERCSGQARYLDQNQLPEFPTCSCTYISQSRLGIYPLFENRHIELIGNQALSLFHFLFHV